MSEAPSHRFFASTPRSVRGFTMFEVCLAIAIGLLLVSLAVPSIHGLVMEQNIKRTFDAFDAFAKKAQSFSMTEHRAYLMVWDKEGVYLRPEASENENEGSSRLDFKKMDSYDLELPASLVKDPPKEWVFWPSGTCEPAIISFKGKTGGWSAHYDPLTVRATFIPK